MKYYTFEEVNEIVQRLKFYTFAKSILLYDLEKIRVKIIDKKIVIYQNEKVVELEFNKENFDKMNEMVKGEL